MLFASLALVFTSALALTPTEEKVSAMVAQFLQANTDKINTVIESKIPAHIRIDDSPIGIRTDRVTTFWRVHKGYEANITEVANLNSLDLKFNDFSVTSTNESVTVALDVHGAFAKPPRLFGSIRGWYGMFKAGGAIQLDVEKLAVTTKMVVTLYLDDPWSVSVKARIGKLQFSHFDIENIDTRWSIVGANLPGWINDVVDMLINNTVDLVELIAPKLELNLYKLLSRLLKVSANGELEGFQTNAFQMLFLTFDEYLSQ